MKIKKNDNIIVITGKDKGKKAKVIKAIPSEDKVIVEGVNIVKRHRKSRSESKKGEVIELAAPIHVSNVKLDKDSVKKTATKKTAKTTDTKKTTKAKK